LPVPKSEPNPKSNRETEVDDRSGNLSEDEGGNDGEEESASSGEGDDDQGDDEDSTNGMANGANPAGDGDEEGCIVS